jgi:protein gp37/ParB-like chromosome segregation protein Spo0J
MNDLFGEILVDGPVEIPVELLYHHPQNPRLSTWDAMVEQIAAQLMQTGSLDQAHALIVRPRPDEQSYEIIAGHHRKLAAEIAGLATVPCWVRPMSDDEAYMALVLTNVQTELLPLEIGLHAIRSGLSMTEYAKQTGIALPTLQTRWQAAKVAQTIIDINKADLAPSWQALSAIHAAPGWLWPSLVTKMLDDAWTVEETRRQVKRLQQAEAPPDWTHAEDIATTLVDGTLKLASLPRFTQCLEESLARITRNQDDAERFHVLLRSRLEQTRPGKLSDVERLCQDVEAEQRALIQERQQADLFRTRREEEIAARIARLKRVVSLDEWTTTLAPDEQDALLHLSPQDVEPASFNVQEGSAIEWAQFSWNPVTGCLHNCPYCYARDIALKDRMAKVYPYGFAPALRPAMLLAPRHMQVPAQAQTDTRYRNVFTCSMADLFGRWVPAEWIDAVLREIRQAPHWNFLCLTKFPKRAVEFALPTNLWMGTTVDLQARVKAAEDAFAQITAGVRWLSVEPMLEPLTFTHLERFDWLVIGGASASSQTPEWHPPFPWIANLLTQARAAGCKVYFKTNLLKKRLLEMPFDAPIVDDNAPAPPVFAYLKG